MFNSNQRSGDKDRDSNIVDSPIKNMRKSTRMSPNDGRQRSSEKKSALRPVSEKNFLASKSKSIRDSRRSKKYEKLQDIPHYLNIT